MNVKSKPGSVATVNCPRGPRAMAETFAVVGEADSPAIRWFVKGLKREMLSQGHQFLDQPEPDIQLVLNLVTRENPQPYRRRAQATFVAAVVELPGSPADLMRTGYPYLVRALANLVIMVVRGPDGHKAHFVTPEQGHYTIACEPGREDAFFAQIYGRIEPLASSQLVINNIYHKDLEKELWDGDEITAQIARAGKRLDEMDLLPAAFPIHELLDARELRHVQRLYGIGGLSYGNLSARKDRKRFWMSASGVNKGKLQVIGQDILMVCGYDPEQTAMVLSVPPTVQPRRVSVDAIEHWMIYQEHPDVGAIVHVHAWMEGIQSTEFNYPCGTVQLAQAVADLIRQERDPAHAVIGLKNHGVTITGSSMDEIFERIEGKIIRQVPMS